MGTGLGVYIPIALYLGFWMCVLASVLWNPRLGLYLAILVAPLQTVRLRLVDYPLGENVLTLLVLSAIIGCLLRGQFPARSPLNASMVVLAAYLYFSVWVGVLTLPNKFPFWFSNPRLGEWKDYMMLPLMCLAASMAVRTRKHAALVMIFVVLSIALVYRSAVLELLLRDYSQYSEDKRPSGAVGWAGPNGLAAFLSQYTLMLIAFVYARVSKIKKIVLGALIAAGSFGLLFSYSRGAYLAFVAGLFTFAVFRMRKLIPVLVLLLVCWQAIAPAGVRERITGTYDRYGRFDDSVASRLKLWDFAAKKVQENPVFGSGHATFQFLDNGTELHDTHNWYIKVLFENGILGMMIYLFLFYRMFLMSFRLYRLERGNWRYLGLGLILCLVSLLVANFFGDRWTYVEVNSEFWVCLGLVSFLLTNPELTAEQTESLPQEQQAYLVPAS